MFIFEENKRVHLEDILRISSLLPVVAYFFSKKRGVKLLQAIFFFNVFYVIFEVIYYSLRLFDKDLSNIFNLFFVPSEYLFIYYVFGCKTFVNFRTGNVR